MPPPTSAACDLEIWDPEEDAWIGLMLADDYAEDGTTKLTKTTTEGLFAAEADAQIAKRLIPQVQEDWSRGIGLDYDWAPGLYTRSPGYVCPAGAVTGMAVPTPDAGRILYHAEYSTDLFFAQAGTVTKGGRVLRSAGGSGALTESLTLTPGEYMRGLLTADNGAGTTLLYAFSSDGGVANGRLHYWNGSTWTSTAAATFGANGRAAAAKVYWTTSDGIGGARIVTISGPRTIAYTKPNADPMLAASYVEGVRIGGSRGQLRELGAAREHIYASAEDGLFDLDELGKSPNLMSYVEGIVQPGNGYAVQYHDGAVFYSLGTGIDRVIVEQDGLLQEMPGVCGPGWGTKAENPVRGWASAMCVDQGFLVAAIFNPTNRESYICYGKSARSLGIESRNPMIWYGPEVTLGFDNQVSAMSVSSLVGASRRLWMSISNDANTVTSVAWASLPFAGAPLQDIYSQGTHKFTTGQVGGVLQPYARLYQLPNTWEDKPSLKILHQHALGTRGLSVVAGVDDGFGTKLVEYDRADPVPGSTAWGVGTDITDSPSDTIAPLTPVKGYEIGRRIDFISPQGGATLPLIAVLNSLRTTAWIVAPSFTVRTADVQWGAGVTDLSNSAELYRGIDPDWIAERLNAVIEYGPTIARDRNDIRKTVKLEQVLSQVTTWHEESPHKTIRARLEMTIIGDVAA